MLNIRNKRLPLFLLIVFVCFTELHAQPLYTGMKDMFLEAESYFLFEEYNEALPLYMRLLRKNPYNDNLNYRIGRCYLHNDYKKEQAIKYLLEASKNITYRYKENSFKETRAPLDVLYYLGEAYRVNNRLKEAIKYYETFLEKMDEEEYEKSLVVKKIETCKNAMSQQKQPVKYLSENLGNQINSRFEERHAVISGDRKTLAFTRELQFYEGIFVSQKQNGRWANPVNIIPELGVDGDVVTSSLNYDGTQLYLYRSDGFDGNLYVSNKKDGKWTSIVKLNKNINTKFWESNACVSTDGQILYFSSNRNGGYGRLDIYKSFLGQDNEWGIPVNLGNTINSPFNEDCPKISENGDLLFFSSFGHNTLGGYDMFYSEKAKDGSWTKPKNIGYPINTTDDELFFAPHENGKYLLLSLFKPKNGHGLKDIYQVELYPDLNHNKEIKQVEKHAAKIETDKIQQHLTEQVKPEGQKDQVTSGKAKLNHTNEQPKLKNKDSAIHITHKKPIIHNEKIQDNDEQFIETNEVTNQPVLKTEKGQYNINTEKEIGINLKTEENADLTIRWIHEGTVIYREKIRTKSNSYIVRLKPEQGNNILDLQLTDNSGNVANNNININYIPPRSSYDEQITRSRANNIRKFKIYNFYGVLSKLKQNASGNLLKCLNAIHLNENMTLDSLMKDLFLNANEFKYDEKDIANMVIATSGLEKEETELFYQTLLSMVNRPVREFLSSLSPNKDNLDSPATILLQIIKNEKYEHYNLDDISHLLTDILFLEPFETIEGEGRNLKEGKSKTFSVFYWLIPLLLIILIILFIIFKRKDTASQG